MALNDWESLSMKERALYIKLAVANGLHTTEDIRLSYNEFKKGGPEETRKLAFLSSLEESLRNNSRYNTPEWRKYLTDLAGRESGYRSNITNSIGAKGYFLLMPFNRATQWTTPTQLFEEMFKMSDANMKWFKKNLTKLDLLKAKELGIDIYGLMAGAHLGGVKGVIRALRGTGNAKDMNGTSVLNYMTSFSLTPRDTPINYTMPVSYPLEVVLLNNYLPFNYTLMDSNEGNIPKNILIVEELPIQKLSSNIIVEEEPLVDPLDIIASVLDTFSSIPTYNIPRPLTATEILALREADRNTLLAKEFESSLLRDNLLGIEEDSNLFQGGGYTQLRDIEKQVLLKLKDFEEKQSKPIMIGYDKDRAFTLSNAGSLTGAHLSEEMTDYIILEAAKAGVDLLTAFGIAAAESTLGNPTDDKSSWNISSGIRRSFNNVYPGTELHINSGGDAVNELELFNFYYPLEDLNPYTQLLNAARRRANNGEDYFKVLAEGMSYADRLALKPISTSSIAQLAMEYYKKHGEGYNPGYKKTTGKSYVQHVLKKGKEALQSPEMQLAVANYALRKLLPSETNIYFAPWNKHSLGGNMFDVGGNKGRYWVDDDNMLPELIVTPKGNSIVRDEAGNPALTVGAIRDINPNATIYERVNRELKDNQYNTELPQWIVNMNADRYANAVSPGIGDLVTAGLKPLDAMMPSRWVGLLDSDNNRGLAHLFDEDNRGFFIGNDPTKPFSKRYAEEHPLWATAGNLVGDVIGTTGVIKGTLNFPKNLIREYIPLEDRIAAAERMNNFVQSEDYIQRLKNAGLSSSEIKEFLSMVSRRLNDGDFPAYYSKIPHIFGALGLNIAFPKFVGGGIYMTKGMYPEQFLNAFDHEVAHYATSNIEKTGNFINPILGFVNRENPSTVEKILDYNYSIMPTRTPEDALKVRVARGLRTDKDWLNNTKSGYEKFKDNLLYYLNELETRANAYAVLLDANRLGMTVDEYIDFCTTPEGEIDRLAPKPLKYLNYAYSPENMKKFLKNFLSVSVPITSTVGLNK